MRYLVVCISLVICFFVVKFAYTVWFRPIDQPTPELLKLEAHFINHNISGHIYAVRHGVSHSRVLSVASFQIDDYPAPFILIEHSSTLIAEQSAILRDNLPEELHPEVNGTVVLDFPAWDEDTLPMASAIRKVFLAYSSKP